MNKVCKDCSKEKLISEFYKSQGECKTCTKERVRLRNKNLMLNPVFAEKERERNRNKYHRLNYKDKHKPTYESKKKAMARYKLKYPEKIKAKSLSSGLKSQMKGNHLHHWSYNPIHAKDVIELTPFNHNSVHRFIKYDKDLYIYRDLKGNLLDTKIKHIEYIDKVLKDLQK